MNKQCCRNCKYGCLYVHIGPPVTKRHAHVFCEREMQENNLDDYCLSWEDAGRGRDVVDDSEIN